jgi:hypothetical protein
MKKLLLFLCCSFIFCVISIAIAGDVTLTTDNKVPGKPFEELQQQIDLLSQQIEEIELIPGPQGEPGIQGIEGEQGIQGIQGEPGCPQISGKIVFLTSTTHTGELGGVAGADAICQGLADAAGLFGTFKAWISDDTSEPLSSFTHSSEPYVTVNGLLVAYNWTDLADSGHLRNEIVFDEEGIYQGGEVWTGTNVFGQNYSHDCNEWSYGGIAADGYYGESASTSSAKWTGHAANGCENLRRLYCFEQ